MVSGSIDRAILHLGAPAALAALLQAGFLVVDTFWLGRVGPVALAAASTAGFTMWLAQTLGEGMASGSGSVLARTIGAGDEPGAARAAVAGQTLGVWSAAIVSGIGLLSSHAVFVFMGTSPDVTAEGLRYMWVIFAGMPAYFIFAWLSAAFRAVGDARTPLKLLAVAAVSQSCGRPAAHFRGGAAAGARGHGGRHRHRHLVAGGCDPRVGPSRQARDQTAAAGLFGAASCARPGRLSGSVFPLPSRVRCFR